MFHVYLTLWGLLTLLLLMQLLACTMYCWKPLYHYQPIPCATACTLCFDSIPLFDLDSLPAL